MSDVQKVHCIPNPGLEYNPHGWFRWQILFERMLKERKPKICLEIGVWTGISAIFVAKIVQSWDGYVIAVDPWDGFVPIAGDENCEKIAPICYEQFISNVYHESLQSRIYVVRGKAIDIPDLVQPDWIYLDGSHLYQDTVDDLRELWPRLKPGGIILGDDFGMDGVQKAWLHYFTGKMVNYEDQLAWVIKASES